MELRDRLITAVKGQEAALAEHQLWHREYTTSLARGEWQGRHNVNNPTGADRVAFDTPYMRQLPSMIAQREAAIKRTETYLAQYRGELEALEAAYV